MRIIVGVIILCVCTPIAMTQQQDFPECPSIADGYHPQCKCRYGPEYDETTNTCPNPECPTNATATPAYPQCDCNNLGRNYAYSEELNKCYRSCPPDASGNWPNCKCDNPAALFKHNEFKCFKCPTGSQPDDIYPDCDCSSVGTYNRYANECTRCAENSTGVYPSCSCDDINATFNEFSNACRLCPVGSKGKVPDCACDNGAEFDQFQNMCRECPFASVGIYPNCECSDGGLFTNGYCKTCPWGSQGNYSECVCDGDAVFREEDERCVACPSESTGIYPDCECETPLEYDGVNNECRQCPQNTSEGTYPDCSCFNAYFSYTHGVCVQCPSDAKGIYPDCECQSPNHTFSTYINECFEVCPWNAVGKHPYCRCDNPLEYYNEENLACRNFTGRPCPAAAIGVGPYCLCLHDNYHFDQYQWSCISASFPAFGYPSGNSCPDTSEKWPQCSDGIDRNALLSLVG